MPQTKKRCEELLEKANSLPLSSGVYIMRDKNGKIVYIGKSRKLKNRVSQYFQQSKKNTKTLRMIACTEDFDYILCKTEIEALTLENALIKQHSPKYNIKLKDAKSYPYIKITAEEYPHILFSRTRAADKGKYYGPFSGSSIAHSILDTVYKTLGIPSCKRNFPQDIGKERPCIYYQMKQCCGLCTGKVTKEEYRGLISCAANILRGNIGASVKELEAQMHRQAEAENFEAAAKTRDTMRALERLNQKQNVVASPDVNTDIFGFYSDEPMSCVSAIYIRDGVVTDKADLLFNTDAIVDEASLASFIAEHYIEHENIPPFIRISFDINDDDRETLEAFLSEKAGHKVHIKKPEKGSFKELSDVAVGNAREKVRQSKLDAQKDEGVLLKLAELLCLETVPERIEAFDISNIGKENITAGMVVYRGGKPSKQEYRTFKIKSLDGTVDDYASMQEAVQRRLRHLGGNSSDSMSEYPDILLIDGGKGHISAVNEVMKTEGIDIPVFGMVKDDFHKTRALCTDTEEINIAREREIYMLIYGIQEEVHRFTVGSVSNAKRSTLRHSSLEKIKGIGEVKAKKLLKIYGGLSGIKNADVSELANISGITVTDAQNIYNYFHSEEKGK